MSIHLVEGVVTSIDCGPSRVIFRIGEQVFEAPPHPEAFALKSGQFVHVLASTDWESEAEDVLVLRWSGGEPIYFGPRLGWAFLALGAGLFVAAIASGTFWLLTVPVLLILIHCDLLARRARIYARFATELSGRLALASSQAPTAAREAEVQFALTVAEPPPGEK
jgi:hypothetical protein